MVWHGDTRYYAAHDEESVFYTHAALRLPWHLSYDLDHLGTPLAEDLARLSDTVRIIRLSRSRKLSVYVGAGTIKEQTCKAWAEEVAPIVARHGCAFLGGGSAIVENPRPGGKAPRKHNDLLLFGIAIGRLAALAPIA